MVEGSPVSSFSVLTTSKSGDLGSRKAGLLRLFNSDFFDSNMALCYLWKYNRHEVGIQFAVCEKLRSMPTSEIEFLLPQLWYFQPLFICLTCQTLWYFENYLDDFRITFPKNGRLYLRTIRLLNELQQLVFRDHMTQSGQLSRSLSSIEEGDFVDIPSSQIKWELAVNKLPGIGVSIVGTGCAFAGIAIPEFTQMARPMILTEAKRLGFAKIKTKKPLKQSSFGPHTAYIARGCNTPSVEDLHTGSAFSLRDYLIKAAKQMNANAPTLIKLSNSSNTAPKEALKGGIPPPVPIFYYAEMQFVMSLIDISKRLISFQKDGRLKALTAELALINHNLPASLCLPLWCKSLDHHRILRLCLSDAVVLNSAERAPFLVQLEVLESDCSEEEFQELIKGCSESNLRMPTLKTLSVSSKEESKSSSRAGSPGEASLNELAVQEGLEKLSIDAEPIYPIRDFPEDNDDLMAMSADDFSERMRTAAIMLAQLTRQAAQPNCPTQKLVDIAAIKARIIREMEMLERNRLLDALQRNDDSPTQDILFVGQRACFDQEDPSAVVFQEAWDEKVQRIQSSSPFGHIDGWRLLSVIVKSGADMRQEQLACQIIEEMTNIWRRAGLPLWTYSYRVLVASAEGGLIETVPNAISLHSIKKNAYMRNKDSVTFTFSLRDHFIKTFGSPDSEPFQNARDHFAESLAAYSLATYLLQVKDRHDGNILLDKDGHLIHIDFGFMLSNSPGYVGFESAPFKLSQEYIELLGGLHSVEFARFKDLMFQGFLELRKHADRILILIDIMLHESRLPCFYAGETALAQLRQRFHLTLADVQLRQVVDRLVISSAYNVFTKLYDTYQYYSNGIL